VADIVTSTVGIHKGDLGDKRFVEKKAVFETVGFYNNKGSDMAIYLCFGCVFL